jgi:hypothetical protein
MDKLARQLREDAERIEINISPQLDKRLQASLTAVEPVRPEPPRSALSPARFWWASSLPPSFMPPKIDWKARTAVLTDPLEQEIEDLQSDMQKAEQAVKQDIERLF